jgi:ferredoxin
VDVLVPLASREGAGRDGSESRYGRAPLGVTLEVAEHETLIVADRRSGYYWPTVCGGRAECRAGWVTVESGAGVCSD